MGDNPVHSLPTFAAHLLVTLGDFPTQLADIPASGTGIFVFQMVLHGKLIPTVYTKC